jgi:tetratricopeptide (TPR) repeat protein
VSTKRLGRVILNGTTRSQVLDEETPMPTLLCGMLLAGMAFGAAPPAALTSEQAVQARKLSALIMRANEEWKAGKREQAIGTMQKVLSGVEKICGRNAVDLVAVSGWLADREEQRGNYARAAIHHERWRRILEVLRGKDDWRTVEAHWKAKTARMRAGWTAEQNKEWLQSFASTEEGYRLFKKGDLVKALRLAKKALEIQRSLVGDKHPDVASRLNNLAFLYQALGDYKVALPLYKRALKVHKETEGVQHPHYAMCLKNYAGALRELAGLYEARGDYKAALALYLTAVKIVKEVLGENNVEYANSLNSLAVLYYRMGTTRQRWPCSRRRSRSPRMCWARSMQTTPSPWSTWLCCTRRWGTTRQHCLCVGRPSRSKRMCWERRTPPTPAA